MSENLSAEMPNVSDTIPQPTPGETPEEFRARLVATREGVTPDERATEALHEMGRALRSFSELPPQEMDVLAGQLNDTARTLLTNLYGRIQRVPYQEPHENTQDEDDVAA